MPDEIVAISFIRNNFQRSPAIAFILAILKVFEENQKNKLCKEKKS